MQAATQTHRTTRTPVIRTPQARTRLAALALVTAAVGTAGAVAAPGASAADAPSATSSAASVSAAAAAASGRADRTLWTSNGAGSIAVHWDWKRSADGRTYYGSFWGTFYDHKKDGKYVLLQAKWKGRGWTTIRSAAYGGTFKGDYSKLSGLNFRACLQGGHCGAAAW
ncbi:MULTISPECIES: hypothetical protein [unclassified Streptomyces]|uniref:hypothetical protein n=1 Tax=unclassified Streptomyces TaxID=2593676 RepID=UPI003D7345E7